jgi:hypothetical protein
MWNGREHFLLIILLSAVAKAMADKFELPMLTFCQTTCVLYQILDISKGKKRYFDADFADFTD